MRGQVKIEIPSDISQDWQEIVDLLAEVVGIPAALIMQYSDPDLKVLVSSKGESNPYHPGDQEVLSGSGLYCETVIRTHEKLHVSDALKDEKWSDNPDIRLGMISYLGLPILYPDKTPFGTLCVLDNKANEFSTTIERLLQKFRSLIESHLELIYINQVLGENNKRLTDYLDELQALRGLVTICANCKSIKDGMGNWHPVEHYLIHHPQADFSHGICPRCMESLYP